MGDSHPLAVTASQSASASILMQICPIMGHVIILILPPHLLFKMCPTRGHIIRASYKEFGHSHWWELIEIFDPKFGI